MGCISFEVKLYSSVYHFGVKLINKLNEGNIGFTFRNLEIMNLLKNN